MWRICRLTGLTAMPQGVDSNTSSTTTRQNWEQNEEEEKKEEQEEELRAICTIHSVHWVQGHQLFRGQRMEGNANEVLQKKCHDTLQTDTHSGGHADRETLGDTYVHHVRPITIIFLTFTLFKLQGSVLASSLLLLSLYQCLSVSLWREGQMWVESSRSAVAMSPSYVPTCPTPWERASCCSSIVSNSSNWPKPKNCPEDAFQSCVRRPQSTALLA